MAFHQPTMEYSVKLNNQSAESGSGKISLVPNYNNVSITYKCTNQSINKFQVWTTFVSDYPEQGDWGKDIGICAIDSSDAVSQNTEATKSFSATSSIFTAGDGLYRLALCARGDIDLTWDVTEILLTVNGLNFIPSDATDFETVVTDGK